MKIVPRVVMGEGHLRQMRFAKRPPHPSVVDEPPSCPLPQGERAQQSASPTSRDQTHAHCILGAARRDPRRARCRRAAYRAAWRSRASTTSRRTSPAFPYVTLGEARIADFSTGTERGEEHQLTLHAWSRQGGHKEAHLVAGALLQALDDAPLTLDDHRLINFRFALADVRREADGRTYHAVVRFRAVTEPQ